VDNCKQLFHSGRNVHPIAGTNLQVPIAYQKKVSSLINWTSRIPPPLH